MIDKACSVFIECCQDCEKHEWCTSHASQKYLHFFNSVKNEIEKEFENIKVYMNINPRIAGKKYTPSLGAFEVVFQDEVIFSKLKTKTWPSVGRLLDKIDIKLGGSGGYAERMSLSSIKNTSNAFSSFKYKRSTSYQSKLPNTREVHSFYLERDTELERRSNSKGFRKTEKSEMFTEASYLPLLTGDMSCTQTENDRKWPKTKFHRRDQTPLRHHNLKASPPEVLKLIYKQEGLSYISFDTKLETEIYTRQTFPSLNNNLGSRKTSSKDFSMQTEEFGTEPNKTMVTEAYKTMPNESDVKPAPAGSPEQTQNSSRILSASLKERRRTRSLNQTRETSQGELPAIIETFSKRKNDDEKDVLNPFDKSACDDLNKGKELAKSNQHQEQRAGDEESMSRSAHKGSDDDLNKSKDVQSIRINSPGLSPIGNNSDSSPDFSSNRKLQTAQTFETNDLKMGKNVVRVQSAYLKDRKNSKIAAVPQEQDYVVLDNMVNTDHSKEEQKNESKKNRPEEEKVLKDLPQSPSLDPERDLGSRNLEDLGSKKEMLGAGSSPLGSGSMSGDHTLGEFSKNSPQINANSFFSSRQSLDERKTEKTFYPNGKAPNESHNLMMNPLMTCTSLKTDTFQTERLQDQSINKGGSHENQNKVENRKKRADSSFPEKKVSLVQVPKDKGTKKKITLRGDLDEDSAIKVHTDTPEILNLESKEIFISKGESQKLSLKFEPQANKLFEEFVLLLFKNGCPWLKIVIQAHYV